MLYNIIINSIELKLYKQFYSYSNKFKMSKFKTIKLIVIYWLYKLI